MVQAESDKIKVLIVDDIAETRENLSKLLYSMGGKQST